MGEADKLKDDYAKKLGKDVIIDDYFDMNKDGLSKLQTMIGNEQIDVVIAPHDVFAKLASFGYFDNLKTTLPAAEYAKVGKYAMAFHGFDDSRVTDAIDESGSGQGKSEPYGLLLEHAPRWTASKARTTTHSSASPRTPSNSTPPRTSSNTCTTNP